MVEDPHFPGGLERDGTLSLQCSEHRARAERSAQLSPSWLGNVVQKWRIEQLEGPGSFWTRQPVDTAQRKNIGAHSHAAGNALDVGARLRRGEQIHVGKALDGVKDEPCVGFADHEQQWQEIPRTTAPVSSTSAVAPASNSERSSIQAGASGMLRNKV